MVDNKTLIMAATTLFSQMWPAIANDGIRSVRLVTTDRVEIKPCMPVYAALHVEMELSEERIPIREAPPGLGREVKINGKAFELAFNSNPVAMYMLDRTTLRQTGNALWSFNVVVVVFWNTEEQQYVFRKAGPYDVELYPGTALRVVVGQPTESEAELVKAIERLGPTFVVHMLNPSDRRARAFMPDIEGLAAAYANTDYASMLNIFLGNVKLNELLRRKSDDPAALLRERIEVVRQHFAPYCSKPPASIFEAFATFQLGSTEMQYLDSTMETRPARPEGKRQRAIDLLREVVVSPYSGEWRESADALLQGTD